MKHKYIFHLKIYRHIQGGREGGTLGCSISPNSTLPSPPFPAPARPDHSSKDHIISNSSPSLSSAPTLSSPNMHLLGEIIVLLETIVRVEISLPVRAEEELSGDIKAQHC